MAINSPIDLQLPQSPRLPPEGNAAVYSEFQSVYFAIRNIWGYVTANPGGGITDAPSDGNTYGRKDAGWVIVSSGTAPVWGAITGDINAQADLIAKFTTINNNITAINTELADLWTALGVTNAAVASLETRMTAAETKNAEQDTRLTAAETAIATKIGDAPSDGQEYVRKNGNWSVATGGGGGGGVYLPVVTGEVPPVFVYLDDGSLVYSRIE